MTTAPKGRTTAIGSLPHHNVDAALEFSFKMGVPFLPQIPLRNQWEFMIPQAVEGLPGVLVDEDGAVTVNLDIWNSRAHDLNRRLSAAFDQADKNREAFEDFEPSAATSSSWQPFVWELGERGHKVAKIQIAGPMTSQWVLKYTHGGKPAEPHPEIAIQIFRLGLARALAMTRKLQANGVQPLLYLDEPGLYGFTPSNPRHMLGLQELKLMVQTLRKEGVQVGLHCCSNTDWNAVLSLPINYLSIDTALSLQSVLETDGGRALRRFIESGGKLSLGVIPTSRSSIGLHAADPSEIFAELVEQMGGAFKDQPELARRILSEALYTPACGLALHSIPDAELVLGSLLEFAEFIKK